MHGRREDSSSLLVSETRPVLEDIFGQWHEVVIGQIPYRRLFRHESCPSHLPWTREPGENKSKSGAVRVDVHASWSWMRPLFPE